MFATKMTFIPDYFMGEYFEGYKLL